MRDPIAPSLLLASYHQESECPKGCFSSKFFVYKFSINTQMALPLWSYLRCKKFEREIRWHCGKCNWTLYRFGSKKVNPSTMYMHHICDQEIGSFQKRIFRKDPISLLRYKDILVAKLEEKLAKEDARKKVLMETFA